MECDVIVPVGPGHEQIYHQAIESVRMASMDKGAFDKINIIVVDDTQGKLGRSKARNDAIMKSTAEWLFFLDADDLMHPDAFKVHSYNVDVDALFGNIYETSQGIAVWRYQVPAIDNYDQLISFDPYYTLQMGHFVRRDIASKILFDEGMNCGEDFKYYIKLWKDYNCKKIRECLFLNRKGHHSQGARSSTGQEWVEVVNGLIEDARLERRPFQMKDGYWFPSSDTHFNKSVFELDHIKHCVNACKEKRVALDIGGHVGGWAKELANHFDTVLSFEANKNNYDCLVKNTEECNNVMLFHNAVGDESKYVSVHRGIDPGNSGQGYIVDGDEVEMVRIDDVVNAPVDFIKMDIEGYEPMALEGAKEIIRKCHPVILIEQTPGISGRYGIDHLAAGRLLELWGYRLERQMNKNYLYVY